MSTTVDERVVEMRFDNSQFERNVQTSMSTLAKLKQSLQLSNASTGLENIGKAANNINFNGVISGISTIETRFSYLQATIQHQINNIVDTAVNAGNRIVSALTVNPVKDGFAEYETQMNAVQTILANTQKEHTTVDQVNAALDTLNTYADKTIYNFTEMTRNIGTFTAAGVKLDTSVSAIQGIANLAAVSGSTSQQASTAMYQLSQALAAGTVKLMDWNSVVNAGMGGQVFQDALTRTSEHLGTGAKAAIEAEGSFRESLSTGWLTTEVLTETLDMFSTAADTQEEYEAAVEKFLSKGYTAEEAKEMASMAKTAGEAATKVKTFTQLIDTLKEALGSGWTTTWRLIIGDFEEAKSVWTGVNDVLSPLIEKVSNARNALVESALGKSFSDLQTKLKGVTDTISKAVEPAKNAVDTVQKASSAIADLGGIVDDVIIGKFGNGQERFDALTNSGINYYEVQNKVNEKLGNSFRYTQEQIDAQNQALGISGQSADNASSSTDGLTDSQKSLLKQYLYLNEAQRRQLGLNYEQIAAMDELKDTAHKLGMTTDEFIDNLDQINGRWLLLNGFKNIGNAIAKVFQSIAKAAGQVFRALSADDIFNMLGAWNRLTSALVISDETAEKLTRTFAGVFSVVDIVARVIKGVLSLAFTALGKTMSNADTSLLDFTASIGDSLVKLRDFLQTNEKVNTVIAKFHDHVLDIATVVGKVIKTIVEEIVKLKDTFVELFEAFKDSSLGNSIANIFDMMFGSGVNADGATEAINGVGEAMNISEEKASNFKKVIDGINTSFNLTNWSWAASLTSTLKLLNAVLGLFGTDLAHVAGIIADYITVVYDWIKVNTPFLEMQSKIAKVCKQIIEGLSGLFNTFKELPQIQKIINNFKDTLTQLFGEMDGGFSIDGLISKISEVFGQINTWMQGLANSGDLGRDIIYGIGNGMIAAIGYIGKAVRLVVKFIGDTLLDLLGNPAGIMEGVDFSSVWDSLSQAFSGLQGWYKKLSNTENIGSYIMEGLGKGISSGIPIVVNGIVNAAKLAMNAFCELLGIHSPSVTFFNYGVNIIQGLADGLKSGLKAIGEAIGNVGNKIIEGFNADKISKNVLGVIDSIKKIWSNLMLLIDEIDFNMIVGIIPVALALLLAKKIWDVVNVLANGVKGIDGVLKSFAGVLDGFKGIEKAIAKDINAKTVQKYAVSILILAGALFIISRIPKEDLERSAVTLAGIAAGMVALALATNKLSTASVKLSKEEGLDASGLNTTLLQIGITLGIMGGLVILLGKADPEELKQGFVALAGCMGALLVAIVAMSLLSRIANGPNVQALSTGLIKVVAALGLMVLVFKMAGKLEGNDILRGCIAMGIFTVFLTALALISDNIPKSGFGKLGTQMIQLMVALGIMVGVFKLAGMLTGEDLFKGIVALSIYSAFIAVVKRISKTNPEQEFVKLGGQMAALSAALLLMTFVAMLANLVPLSGFGKMIIVIGEMLLLVLGLESIQAVTGVEKMAKISATVLSVSVALMIIAATATICSLIPDDGLIKGIAAVTAFAVLITIMTAATSGIKTDLKGTFMMMAACIAIMAASVAILSLLKIEKVIPATACMASLIGMMALAESQAGKMQGAEVAMGIMAATIAIIAISIRLLATLPVKGCLGATASLSLVLIALTTCMMLIGESKTMSLQAAESCIVMCLVLDQVSRAMTRLLKMKNVDQAIPVAASLGIVLLSLSAAMLILSKISSMSINVVTLIEFAAAMAILCVALKQLAPALQTMENIGWDSMAKAGVALVGLAVALNLMNGTLLGLAALLIAAEGLKVMASAMGTFSKTLIKMESLDIGTIAKNMLVLSVALAALGVGALVAAPGILLLAVALVPLSAAALIFGAAASLFGTAAVKIATALDLMTTVGPSAAKSFIGSIRTLALGILQLIPELVDATTQAIVAVCESVINAAPKVGEAVVSLIVSVLQAVIQRKAEMVSQLAELAVELLNGLTEHLPELIDSLVNFVTTLLSNLKDHIPELVTSVVDFLGELMGAVVDNLGPIIDEIIVPLVEVFSEAFSTIFTAIGPYIPTIVQGITDITEAVCEMVVKVTEAIAPFIPNIEQIVFYITQAIATVCSTVLQIVEQISPIIQSITGLVQQLGDSISQVLNSICNVIQTVGTSISTILLSLGSAFESAGTGIKTALDGVADIIDSFGETITGTLEGVSDVLDSLGDTFDSVFDGISEVVESVGKSIKDILDGVADVISSIGEAALDAGTGFENLANGVKTITNLNLFDMGASLGAVATGVAKIAESSEGLAEAGTGITQIATAASSTTTSFATMNTDILLLTMMLSTIGTTATTAMDTLKIAVGSVGTCFTQLSATASTSMSAMMLSMAVVITTQSSVIVSAINTMMSSVILAVSGKSEIFAAAGLTMMTGLSTGITVGSLMVISLVTITIDNIVNIITTSIPRFTAGGISIMNGLNSGIVIGGNIVVASMLAFISRLLSIITAANSRFASAGAQLMNSLANGILSGASSATSAVIGAINSACAAISAYSGSFYQAGVWLGDGLISGINSKAQAAYDAGYQLGKSAAQGELDGQKSASPSKITIQGGKWLGEGLIIGMGQMENAVYKSGKSMGATAADSITNSLSSINDISSTELGFAPSITPVVDMNEIQNGSRSLSIGANLSANLLNKPVTSLQRIISGTQEEIYASNGEVINAINDLRADLNAFLNDDSSEVALYMDSKKVASTLVDPLNTSINRLNKLNLRKAGVR